MPNRPPRHKAKTARPSPTRPSAAKRGYGHAHRQERLAYLMAHPMCAHPGCTQPATEMDHIIPLSQLDSAENTERQGLCKRHHSIKTCTEDGGLGIMKGDGSANLQGMRERG